MEDKNQVNVSEAQVGDAVVSLNLQWSEAESIGTARVGSMYCFKSCDVNNN